MENKENMKLYKEALEGIVAKSNDDFEKQLSYISAGALGLSLTFMDKIVKNLPTAQNKNILILGWIFLGLTLVVNLISHLITSILHNKTIDDIQNNREIDKVYVSRNRIIAFINWLSVALLAIGLLFILIFSSINL